MFWESVWQGLAMLGHWEVWIAVAFYEIAYIAYLVTISGISGSEGAGVRQAAGCLANFLLGPIVQGVLMGLLVAFLLPSILGVEGTTPVSQVIESMRGIAIAGVIAVVIVIIASFIPIVDSFISQWAGIQTFIIGLVILRLFSGGAIDELLARTGKEGASVYPSLW